MRVRDLFLLGLGLSCAAPALADLPLTVEDLTADKNKFKLTSSLSYFNQSRRDWVDQGYSLVDLGNGRVLALPNSPTEETSNIDSLIGTLGVDYGLSDRLDIGLRTNAVYRQTRSRAADRIAKNSEASFQDVWLSAQYQATKNHQRWPDSLFFAEVALRDKTEGLAPKSFAAALVGATVYTVNDPIVVSFTGSYRRSADRLALSQNDSVRIGDTVSLSAERVLRSIPTLP